MGTIYKSGIPYSGGGGGGEYTAGNGIDITNDEISIDDNVVATKTDVDTTLLKYWTLTSGKQNSLTALTTAEVADILNT